MTGTTATQPVHESNGHSGSHSGTRKPQKSKRNSIGFSGLLKLADYLRVNRERLEAIWNQKSWTELAELASVELGFRVSMGSIQQVAGEVGYPPKRQSKPVGKSSRSKDEVAAHLDALTAAVVTLCDNLGEQVPAELLPFVKF